MGCASSTGPARVEPVGLLIVPLLRGLPVFIFGFTCQQNVFTICNEVANASNRRLNGIILSSYILSAAVFAVVALLGYLTYGDAVAQDVLKAGYPSNVSV